MNNKIAIIGNIALLCTATSFAASNELSQATSVIGFAQSIAEAGNLTLTAYPSYAPDLVNGDGQKDQWGASVALTYSFSGDIGSHLFTGVRLDYIGSRFWAPSVTGGVSGQFQIGPQNFDVVGYGGVIKPLSGSDDYDYGAIAGAGIKTTVKTWEKTSLSIGVASEKWSNFNGLVHHIGVMFTIDW